MIVQATTVMCECTLMVLIFISFLVSTIYTYWFYYAERVVGLFYMISKE